MIRIDKNLINQENKNEYMKYYQTILNTIDEAYHCAYYLKGIEEYFDDYELKYNCFEYFIKDTLHLLKEKICLNICKLFFDKGSDVLTLDKMREFIIDNFKIEVKETNINVDESLKDNIKSIRNNLISHNLNKKETPDVFISDLMPILAEITANFEELWIDELIDSNKVGNDFFTYNEDLYKQSVKEVLAGIKL